MTVTTLLDVEAALMRSITDDELGHVDRVVALVEAEILGQLPGYDLNPASAETVTLTGTYEDTLTLPKYPVTAVASVSQYGAVVAASGWTWTAKGYLTRITGAAWPVANGPDSPGTWGGPYAPVTVTYTHGQPTAGSPLVLLIAEAVAAHLMSAGANGLRSMSLGDYSESYGPRTPVGSVDRRRLAPYRRATIGSVRLVGA